MFFGKRKRTEERTDHETIIEAVEAAACEWKDDTGSTYEPIFERSSRENYVDVFVSGVDNVSVVKLMHVVESAESLDDGADVSPSLSFGDGRMCFRVKRLTAKQKRKDPVSSEKIKELDGKHDKPVIQRRLEQSKVDEADVGRVASCVDFMRHVGTQEDILVERSQMKYDVVNTPERLILTVKGITKVNENLILALKVLENTRDVKVKFDFETNSIRCDVAKQALPVSM